MSRVQRSRGYILVAILALLVVMSIVAMRMHNSVQHYALETGHWQEWANLQAKLHDARDQVLYYMLTQSLSDWGFGKGRKLLRIDGRPYRMPSGVMVSVQDERGLMSVNEFEPVKMRQILHSSGLSSEAASRLTDALMDYTDIDDLRRLNGAESSDYERARKQPPANDYLKSAYELKGVMGWEELSLLHPRPSDFFTATREPWINVNTAPLPVLKAFGLDDAQALQVIEHRELAPIRTPRHFQALSGNLISDDEPFWFYPGIFYRIRAWSPDAYLAREWHIMFFYSDETRPWRVLASRAVARPGGTNNQTSDVQEFPTSVQTTLQ